MVDGQFNGWGEVEILQLVRAFSNMPLVALVFEFIKDRISIF